MDIPKIISVDFGSRRKVNLPEASLNRPERKRFRETFVISPQYDFLLKAKSLEGIIQILRRASLNFPEDNQRYSYYSGLSKTQWCAVLENKVRNAKSFSDD